MMKRRKLREYNKRPFALLNKHPKLYPNEKIQLFSATYKKIRYNKNEVVRTRFLGRRRQLKFVCITKGNCGWFIPPFSPFPAGAT